MLITPTVNYRDLLRRLLLCVEDTQMVGIQLAHDLFSEEERKVLKDLYDNAS